MNILLILVSAIGALASLRLAFGGGADNPNWELRWRGLDPGYRDWLAAMTTSRSWMKTLTDPEEVELAKGFARREERRRAYLDLVATTLLLAIGVLALGGLLATSAWTLSVSIYWVARALGEYGRHQQIRHRLADRSDSEAAPPRQGTGSATA